MTRFCSWFIRTDANNTIHQWRVLRFRLAVGWGLLIATAVAIQLVNRPDNIEKALTWMLLWMTVHQLIYLRHAAATLVISQKKMAAAGFNRYPITDRKKMERLIIITSALGVPIFLVIAFA